MQLKECVQMRAVEVLESRVCLSASTLSGDFGRGGVLTFNVDGGVANAHAVAVQSDGKVVVAGDTSFPGTSNPRDGFFAERFNTDGTLDDGGDADLTGADHFGTNGIFTYGTGTGAFATAMAIQPDGKIILAGYADSGGSSPQQYWLILRLNTNGTLDKTFNHTGVAGFQFDSDNTPLAGIALQPDGKIVAVGTDNGNFLVARFTTAGAFDTAFGTGGSLQTDFGGTDSASAVAIDKLGKIDVVGGVGGDGVNQDIGIARYLPNGTLDPSFGTGGKVMDSAGFPTTDVSSIALRSDGDLLVGNNSIGTGANAFWRGNVSDFDDTGTEMETLGFNAQVHDVAALANDQFFYAANTPGSVDGFQVGGEDLVSNTSVLSSTTASASATALAVAPDGSVFAAGYQDASGGKRNIVLAEFTGVSPSSFGSISGTVFADTDGDGVKDSNEKPLSHIRVYIDSNLDGMWDSLFEGEETFTFTDSNGNYTIPGLGAGTYHLREVIPAGDTYTLPVQHVYLAKVAIGATSSGKNFADAPAVVPSTITAITGNVFNDLNDNKLRDIVSPTEPDLAGIVVYIDANKNGKLDSTELHTTTNASGNYTLHLPKAGKYRVAVVVPKHWKSTTAAFFGLTVHTHAQVIARFGLLRSS